MLLTHIPAHSPRHTQPNTLTHLSFQGDSTTPQHGDRMELSSDIRGWKGEVAGWLGGTSGGQPVSGDASHAVCLAARLVVINKTQHR